MISAATDRGSALVPPPPSGWQLLALASEITEQVTGLALGSRALVAIRHDGDDGKVRVFDGTCPHRGAHLGHGGRVASKQSIVCPFHGKRIGLGAGTGRLCVREHETIDCGGAIFVRLSDLPVRDLGFEQVMKGIASTHAVVPAVIGQVGVPPELIIENAFDFTHFPMVHLVPRLTPPKLWLGSDGELNITTAFHTPAPDWEAAEGDFTSDFHARAFSPNLVVSELGSGDTSKFVITGAVPTAAGCVARIAIAIRRGELEETVAAVVDGSRIAFEQDLVIWNNLDLSAPVRLDTSDAPVLAFRAFCDSFTARSVTPEAARDHPRPARELTDPAHGIRPRQSLRSLVDIHVETTGHGPAVLWIHGYTMDSTLWHPLWDLLPGFRHVGIDLPGHGRSGPLSSDETLPALASRIGEIAQVERACRIVALSFGSAVALQLAISHPDLVSRLAIAAPTIAGAQPAAGAIDREMQLALLYRMAGPGPHMTKLWMTSPPDIFLGTQGHPELRARLQEVIGGHSWAELGSGAMRSLNAHLHTDEALSRISAATLVIIGDQDMAAFSANASRLAAAIPDCTLVTMPNAGHLCLLERPGQVTDRLAAHLR